jgi:hypothetical protein
MRALTLNEKRGDVLFFVGLSAFFEQNHSYGD